MMLVNDKETLSRLNSPDNLVNRLSSTTKRNGAMSLFTGSNGNKVLEAVEPKWNPFEKKSAEPAAIAVKTEPVITPEVLTAEEPKTDDLINNVDGQVKLALAHNNALDIMGKTLDMLKLKLDDIRPDKLPAVLGSVGKVVESIRKEKIELTNSRKSNQVHFHFYEPARKNLTDFEIIDA